ncbi:hypothetical protein PTSG_09388 [Salpingoeca rosetta]|uniref:GST N-terminal domain-containing protein n=1 Tax=Salpingoeca rosetta (strain ATCC 50818 / BSB-021) TaxID=946362 RepID=F2UMH3_SALR5|nr:uncharacterized protein PTSG_09388 [Salpingoeca rosetta]EGD78322.1 hypothetical protein PTSG_09388 [Salpingoeca rosetta]|eukprot:XP_004989645.1 hypothetical protein PTSG_09388 [Salpingoeca rosetta]
MWLEVVLAGGSALAAVLLVYLYRSKFMLPRHPEAPDTPRSGNPADEVVLYSFPPVPGTLFSTSPFGAKLEIFLRLANIPFTTKPADLARAPKGKVPYIQHGNNLIGDSTFIIRYLLATYGKPHQSYFGKLRLSLTPYEVSIGHMVQVLCETNIYNALLWSRWLCGESDFVKNNFFGMIPRPIRGLIFAMVQRSMFDWLWGQGFIRHSPHDVVTLSKLDIDAIDTLLGNKSFLFGDEPTVYDCTAFSFLEPFVNSDLELQGLRTYVCSKGRIVNFVNRMRHLIPQDK